LVSDLTITGGTGAGGDGLGHSALAVAGGVAHHLSAAGGVTDEDDVVKVEGVDQCSQVGGVGVHVVAVPGLRRAPVRAPVMSDGAEAVVGGEL
jgi:hypothetical protein